MVMCVVLNVTHLHFKLRLRNCWDGEMCGTTILPLSQWAQWFLFRDVGSYPVLPTAKCEKKRERETTFQTSLSFSHHMLNALSQPRFPRAHKDQKGNIRLFTSVSLPNKTEESADTITPKKQNMSMHALRLLALLIPVVKCCKWELINKIWN